MIKLSVLLAAGCIIMLSVHPLNADGDEATTETTVAPTSVETSPSSPPDDVTTKSEEQETSTKDSTTPLPADSDDAKTVTTLKPIIKKLFKRPFPNLAPFDRPTPDREDDSMFGSNQNSTDTKKFLLIIPFPKMAPFPHPPSSWGPRPSLSDADEDPANERRIQRPRPMPFPNFAPFPSFSPYPRYPSPWSSRRPVEDDDDNVKGKDKDDDDDDEYRKAVVRRSKRDVQNPEGKADSSILTRIVRSATSLDLNLYDVIRDSDFFERRKRCGKKNNTTESTEPVAGDQIPNKETRSTDKELIDTTDTTLKKMPKKYQMMKPAKLPIERTEESTETTTTIQE